MILLFSQHNGLVVPSLLSIVIFLLYFLVYSLPMSVNTRSDCCLHPNYFAEQLLFRHIPPTPWKDDSLLVLYSANDAINGDQYCNGTINLSLILAADGPPIKNLPGLIIQWRRADNARRRERRRDLASNSFWPSAVRSLSTPQPLGNRCISPLASSACMQVLGVGIYSKFADVFTGK